jgi:hypothetical protein
MDATTTKILNQTKALGKPRRETPHWFHLTLSFQGSGEELDRLLKNLPHRDRVTDVDITWLGFADA